MGPDSSFAARWFHRVWFAIGAIILLLGLGYVSSRVSLVLTPFVIALFPAALLAPIATRLRSTRLPNALVALLLLLSLLAVVAGAATFITFSVIAQLPSLTASLATGLGKLQQSIDWSTLRGNIKGAEDLLTRAGEALSSGAAVSQGLGAAEAIGSFLTGLLLMCVVLFFFLKDGRRIWRAFLGFVPDRHQTRVDEIANQSFWTIGAFLRAQLLVALADAVLIGIGLWILQVPLAIPLSVLVFFGGLFPIVGAVASGAVAVLVALADGGVVTALLVLGVVLLVQQVEGHVLQPFIQSRIISLHPLVVILAVVAGGILMGVLGAFLAVPVAAVIARLVDNLRGRPTVGGYHPAI